MDNTTWDEDIALKNALYQSALESSKHPMDRRLNARKRFPEEYSISESIRLHQSNELELLSAPDADVLVVIGVPPRQPDQSDQEYASIKHHFSRHHRIHSKNIRSLGSAKFDELLGPTSQFRTERRLKNQGILPGGKPVDIRYLLDLRPPVEDEEAIVLITQLSCTSGILTWFKAQEKYDISCTMVCGQDHSSLLSYHHQMLDNAQRQSTPVKKESKAKEKQRVASSFTQSHTQDKSSDNKESKPPRIGNWEGILPTVPVNPSETTEYEVYHPATANDDSNNGSGDGKIDSLQADAGAVPDADPKPTSTLQLEYSQLRHWSAIERLLHAIEGNDPILDSGPKVWTFYAVANYFGCASNERISGWIATWLFPSPNNNFIQCNPEVCYRIGLGIQSEILLKDAFSLLVGEKALINIHRENHEVENFNPQLSVAGRKLECLDDDELNRVDHAASVFIRRIQSKYDALVGEDMLWLERSPSFAVLANFNPHSGREKAFAKQLRELIKSYVRSRIMWVLARDYRDVGPDMEYAPESVQPFYPHMAPLNSTYNNLSKEERVFTRLFWLTLREEHLLIGDFGSPTPQLTTPPGKSFAARLGWSTLARTMKQQIYKGMVTKTTLDEGIIIFDGLLRGRLMHAQAAMGQDWSEIDPYGKEKDAAAFADEACSGTPSSETGIGNSWEKDKAAGSSIWRDFEGLQVSTPKLADGIDSLDIGDQQRASVDNDDTSDDGYRPIGKHAELPIRLAASQDEVNEEPVKERITGKVPQEEPLEGARALHERFAYIDMTVPTVAEPHSTFAEIETKESSRSRSVKVTPRKKPQIVFKTPSPIDQCLTEITHEMHAICDEIMFAAHFFHGNEILPTNLIDTLVCLTDDEWQYLPLWAGGCDDGSGGVFADKDVPIDETGGFVGGTRGLECGEISSLAGSSGWSEVDSTVGKASKEATDGSATETATVQSFEDVDMGVESIADGASAQDTETVLGLDADSIYNHGNDSEDEDMDLADDEDATGDDVVLDDGVAEEPGESGWDDCDM